MLQAADGLILTLKDVPLFRYGVSPNKLYDYYAAAKPVIVAVGGSVNQEVQTHNLGFAVAPEKPEELALAMLELAEISPETRHQMGRRARQIAENTYSRQAVAEKFYQLIQNGL